MRFALRTTCHDRWDQRRCWLGVVIHPDHVALNTAAGLYRPNERPLFADDAAVACWQPASDGRSDRYHAGTLRFAATYLTTEVITHECVHAAATISRIYGPTRLVLGAENGEREERLAYLAGDLTAQVLSRLRP